MYFRVILKIIIFFRSRHFCVVSNIYKRVFSRSDFYHFETVKFNLLFRAIKICVADFGMNAARSMSSTAIRTILRSDLRPADPDFRSLYKVLIHCFQPIFVFYQEGVLERPSNIPLERFVEEIKFYGLQKQAIGENKGISSKDINFRGPLKFLKIYGA